MTRFLHEVRKRGGEGAPAIAKQKKNKNKAATCKFEGGEGIKITVKTTPAKNV